MRTSSTTWITATGGIAWGLEKDHNLVMPIFTAERNFRLFDDLYNNMDKSQIVISIVEFHDSYSMIFYEEPKEKLTPAYGFLIKGMDLEGGYYNEFKKKYATNKKVMFSYNKQIESPMKSEKKEMPFLCEDVLVKTFRIINEPELELNGFEEKFSNSTDMTEFKYPLEAFALTAFTPL